MIITIINFNNNYNKYKPYLYTIRSKSSETDFFKNTNDTTFQSILELNSTNFSEFLIILLGAVFFE